MKYIDSIIFRWVKEGYKKREDIKRKKDYTYFICMLKNITEKYRFKSSS